jgi:hypothetical protein
MVKTNVGFEVVWQHAWPLFDDLQIVPEPGRKVTILPGMRLPADHPVVLLHTGYFRPTALTRWVLI